MDANDIKNRMYESFDMANVEKRQAKAQQQRQAEPQPMPSEPVDYYQINADAQYENAMKNYPKGSRALVLATTQAVINGEGGAEGLARAYRRFKNDSDSLRAQGENSRATLLKQQYMEDHFLPAVEVVVNFTSPDELLNCKQALSNLDKYVMSVGSGTGYTAAYVRSAYNGVRGNQRSESDPTVLSGVRRIKAMANGDQVRAAYGLAQKLKKQIDNGEHIASDEDYALIGRVAAFK